MTLTSWDCEKIKKIHKFLRKVLTYDEYSLLISDYNRIVIT